MTESGQKFCSWGMYAFTPRLQAAWRALHANFLRIVNGSQIHDLTLRFDTDENTLRHPGLFVGQTCGYPLIKYYRDTLTPVCVPVFDVDGCDDTLYSSTIIVNKNHPAKTLAGCAGQRAAINGADSNSGMNLLRDAVASITETSPFFGETKISGGHLASARMVAEGVADVATIDCVTFAMIRDAYPGLASSVRQIGFTSQTAALPFVVNTPSTKSDIDRIVSSLQEALTLLHPKHKSQLYLRHFTAVDIGDYLSIDQMETAALARGHKAEKI